MTDIVLGIRLSADGGNQVAGEIRVPREELVKLREEMGRSGSEARRLNDEQTNLSHGMGRLRGVIGALAAAGTAWAGALALQVKHVIETRREVDLLARRTGSSVEELSRLKYVADVTGVSFNDLARAIKQVPKSLVEAGNPRSEAGRALSFLGIDAEQMKSGVQFIRAFAEAIQRVEDPLARSAAAQMVFKQSGDEILPVLTENIQRVRELEAAGARWAEISGRDAEQTRLLSRQMVELQYASGEVAKDIASKLVPRVNDAAAAFLKSAREGRGLLGILDGIRHFILGNERQQANAAVAAAADALFKAQNNLLADQATGNPNRIAARERQIERLTAAYQALAAARDALEAPSKPPAPGGPPIGGRPDTGGGSGRDEAEKLLEQQTRFTEGLVRQAETLGMTRGEAILYEAKMRALPSPLMAAAEWAARTVDAWDAQQEALKRAGEAQREYAAAFERGFLAPLKALDDQIARQRDHNAEIGLTREELATLEQQRLAEAIAAQEQRLALAQLHDASMSEIAAIQMQIAKLKELRELRMHGAQRQAQVDAADEARKANERAAQEAQRAWERTAESIERSIIDSIVRGWERGESVFKNGWESLKRWLLTTALTIPVRFIAQGVTGALSALGLPGLANAAGGGAGAGFNLLGLGNSFAGSSLYTSFATSSLGQSLGLSSVLEAGMSSELALTSLGSTVGTALPYIGIALAAGKLLGAFGSNKIPAVDLGDPNNVAGTLQARYAQLLTAFGGSGSASFYYGSNTGAQSQNPNFVLQALAGNRSFQTGEQFGSFQAATPENIQTQMARALLTALQGSQLPRHLSAFFDTLVPEAMSGAAINEAIEYSVALDRMLEQLTMTEAEIGAKRIGEYNAALGTSISTLEEWETAFVRMIANGMGPEQFAQMRAMGQVLEQIDATAASTTQSLSGLLDGVFGLGQYADRVATGMSALRTEAALIGAAMASTIARFREGQRALNDYAQSLIFGPLSTLSPEARYQAAQQQLNDLLYGHRGEARSLTPEILEQLPGISQQFLEASRAYYGSGAGYASDFDFIQGVLGHAGSRDTYAQWRGAYLMQQRGESGWFAQRPSAVPDALVAEIRNLTHEVRAGNEQRAAVGTATIERLARVVDLAEKQHRELRRMDIAHI